MPKFQFISEYLKETYGDKSITTHLVDTGRLSSGGNPIYKLNVYDKKEQIGTATVLKLKSKKGNHYFSVIS